MKEETRAWFEKALRDFRAAKNSCKAEDYDWTAFQCQQAVEKALKALMIEEKGKSVKAHELDFLAREMNLPGQLINLCDELAPAYTATRYPDAEIGEELYNEETAKKMLQKADEVLKWIEKKIKS